jgi:hypothetical protein
MVVQAPAPQLSENDWHPRVNESFDAWVTRLAAQHKEETGNAKQITSTRTL